MWVQTQNNDQGRADSCMPGARQKTAACPEQDTDAAARPCSCSLTQQQNVLDTPTGNAQKRTWCTWERLGVHAVGEDSPLVCGRMPDQDKGQHGHRLSAQSYRLIPTYLAHFTT